MPLVELPAALRPRGTSRAKVKVEGATVAQALEAVCRAHPELRPRLFTGAGQLKRTIGIFVGEDDVRSEQQQEQKTNHHGVPSFSGEIGAGSGMVVSALTHSR